MFSGIIETKAQVLSVKKVRAGHRLAICPQKKLKGLKQGGSIAINGVCLTLVSFSNQKLEFDVVPETWKLTNLSLLKTGDRVNLERALCYGDRIDGHYVLGHVEGTGKLKKITQDKKGVRFQIQAPRKLLKFIVHKGCIALDGVSLTVSQRAAQTFEVCLIPHTLKLTNLAKKKVGSVLNLETDIFLRA